jgi:hypothetical protein
MSIYFPCSMQSLFTNPIHLDVDMTPSISIPSIASVYMEKAVKDNNSGRISAMPKAFAELLLAFCFL